MTAREILNAAFDDLGIKQVNESLTAADATDGLARLNRLVAYLKTQALFPLALQRYVFRLTAGQQQYSIGLGAEFNVSRPQSVQSCSLLLDGLTAAQSATITRSGTTATVTATAHGFTTGESIFVFGCTAPEYNQLQVVTSTPTADTFTYQVFGEPTSPAAGTPTVQGYSGTPTEVTGRTLLSWDAFIGVQIKGLTNAQFTNVFYNPTQPYGTVWLWPIPSTADNQLVLYTQSQFDGFTSLTQDYTFPDLPGYGETLEYLLARRLIGPYGISDQTVVQNVIDLGRQALGAVKRQNASTRMTDLPTDAAALTFHRRSGYNINTDAGA